jgi:hypothetical protein
MLSGRRASANAGTCRAADVRAHSGGQTRRYERARRDERSNRSRGEASRNDGAASRN